MDSDSSSVATTSLAPSSCVGNCRSQYAAAAAFIGWSGGGPFFATATSTQTGGIICGGWMATEIDPSGRQQAKEWPDQDLFACTTRPARQRRRRHQLVDRGKTTSNHSSRREPAEHTANHAPSQSVMGAPG